MKEKIKDLIDLKSIITLSLVLCIEIGFGFGKIDGNTIKEFGTMVLIFYFGKAQGQVDKYKG